ncbi:MAG: alpha/beta hydrolase-fold protein [Clostridiales bacterium]
MKIKVIVVTLILILLSTTFTSVNLFAEEREENRKKYCNNSLKNKDFIIPVEISSNYIKNNNLVNDDGKKTQYVYLPPSYYKSKKSYPIVYYFHGFSGTTPNNINNAFEEISSLMKDGLLEEMIIVEVNSDGPISGTFMQNSPVTGLWEKYFFKEVVKIIEKDFRVIKKPEFRGISGMSMGGYIAVNLAFKYPNFFSSVYSVSPGLLIDDELNIAFKSWDDTFKKAYGCAFAPRVNSEELYVEPKFDGSKEDEIVINEWLSGFGNINERISDYISNKNKLSHIALEVGENDYFTWILSGTKRFSEKLFEKNIDHKINITDNGHEINNEIITDNVLNFFSNNLKQRK